MSFLTSYLNYYMVSLTLRYQLSYEDKQNVEIKLINYLYVASKQASQRAKLANCGRLKRCLANIHF